MDLKIKYFLTDLDGTLTDGTYMVFAENNDVAKRFHTRDFHGFTSLNNAGVKVGIITGARSDITRKQVERSAPFAYYATGIKDKVDEIERHILSPSVKWENIAYIGDDEYDIGPISKVGLAACPADADEEVKAMIEVYGGTIMTRDGGRGCVREFINMVLKINNG